MNDLRRANAIGPQLARFETRFGRLQREASDVQTEVLKVLLKIEEELAPITELLIRGVDTAAKNGDKIASVAGTTADVLIQGVPLVGDIYRILKIIKPIAELWSRDQKKPKAGELDPATAAFMEFFAPENNPIKPVRGAAAAPAARGIAP
jgi:hypothetical protein